MFCALPHLRAWLDTLTPDRREHVVINMDCPDLAGLIDLSGVRITREPDRSALLGTLEPEGISALHSIRDLNYSLPVNIHPLLSGILGLPTAGNAGLAAFTDALLRYGRLPRGIPLQCSYCVVHLEFARDHAGRALRPASASAVVARCTQIFDTVVIVGNQRQVTKPRGTGGAEVIDLQGKLSVCQLTAVIAHATCFVGIDSFPAHVAQAAGIRSAVFYGAVHPLARVWDQAKVWPLTAELDCIGCYHKHLESSAPYCMRLDEACGEGPTTDRVEAVLLAMKRNQPFDWRRTQQRFLALQAKWLGYLRHHPAPPDRLLRESTGSNEQVSNMVYKILDCVGELAGSRYHTTAVTTMIERVQRLKSALSTRNRELDEMSRLLSQIWHGRRPQVAPEARTSQNSIEIHTMALQQHRCQTWVNGDWLDVEAVDNSSHVAPADYPRLRGQHQSSVAGNCRPQRHVAHFLDGRQQRRDSSRAAHFPGWTGGAQDCTSIRPGDWAVAAASYRPAFWRWEAQTSRRDQWVVRGSPGERHLRGDPTSHGGELG